MFKKGERVDLLYGSARIVGVIDGVDLGTSKATQKPVVMYHVFGKLIHADGSVDKGTISIEEDVEVMALETVLEVLDEYAWMADTLITHHQTEARSQQGPFFVAI